MFFLNLVPGSHVSFNGPPLGWPANAAATVRWIDWTRGLVGLNPAEDPRWEVTVTFEELVG
jgi:hypothetical protein